MVEINSTGKVMENKPFQVKYPLTKEEAIEYMFQYQYSRERKDGRTFRNFLIRKLGKR